MLNVTAALNTFQGRRSPCPYEDDDPVLNVAAALGGSRREARTAST